MGLCFNERGAKNTFQILNGALRLIRLLTCFAPSDLGTTSRWNTGKLIQARRPAVHGLTALTISKSQGGWTRYGQKLWVYFPGFATKPDYRGYSSPQSAPVVSSRKAWATLLGQTTFPRQEIYLPKNLDLWHLQRVCPERQLLPLLNKTRYTPSLRSRKKRRVRRWNTHPPAKSGCHLCRMKLTRGPDHLTYLLPKPPLFLPSPARSERCR